MRTGLVSIMLRWSAAEAMTATSPAPELTGVAHASSPTGEGARRKSRKGARKARAARLVRGARQVNPSCAQLESFRNCDAFDEAGGG